MRQRTCLVEAVARVLRGNQRGRETHAGREATVRAAAPILTATELALPGCSGIALRLAAGCSCDFQFPDYCKKSRPARHFRFRVVFTTDKAITIEEATVTTTSKIKIKLGAIEVEYEGSETFLKEELPALLTAVSDLYQSSQIHLPPNGAGAEPVLNGALNGASSANGAAGPKGAQMIGTTNAIAARLDVKSGPDLVLAAAARLTIGEGVGVFSRQRLIEEMRTAPSYCNKSVISNLSTSLQSLIKANKLNEPTKGHYALTASSQSELEARLA